MGALVALLVIFGLFLTVARVAAVALEATNMSRVSSQFQARSALMGVGFTTAEAEDVIVHPIRRRIILWLMTFGNAGLIGAMGSFILAFLGTGSDQSVRRSLYLAVGIAVIYVATHLPFVTKGIDQLTRWALYRYTELDFTDFASLLRFEDDYSITELHARSDEWWAGRRLRDLHLTSEGVVVLGIHRANGKFIGAPTGDTVIEPDDELLAYGRVELLHELAVRKAGPEGDSAHRVAVAKQDQFITDQADD
jgi:hypothetical protein